MGFAVSCFLFSFLGAFALAEDSRDSVILKSGKELRGRVVWEGSNSILLRSGGKEQQIEGTEIQSIDSVRRQLYSYLRESIQISNFDIAARLSMAKRLTQGLVPKMAKLEAWGVLARDPSNPEANKILGHRKKGEIWLMPCGNNWLPIDEAQKYHSDFSRPWELETEHFSIRSSQNIFEVAKMGRDLERFYYDLLIGMSASQLRETLKPIRANLFREAKDFPNLGANIAAYFNPNENAIYVVMDRKVLNPTVFHELAHAVLHNGFVTERGGSLPAWLDEGLAEYWSYLVAGQPGHAFTNDHQRNQPSFDLIKNENEPFSIKAMLSMSSADFAASTKQTLRYAQVYTFVYFLMEAKEQAYRAKFFEFFQEILKGTYSPTRFQEVMGSELEQIEAEWKQFVKS